MSAADVSVRRSPGQVSYEANGGDDWDQLSSDTRLMCEQDAAAVLSDAAQRRAEAGLVVVDACDLLRVMSFTEANAVRTSPAAAALVRLRSALATPTPKEADR